MSLQTLDALRPPQPMRERIKADLETGRELLTLFVQSPRLRMAMARGRVTREELAAFYEDHDRDADA